MKSTNQRDFEPNYHIIRSADNFRKKALIDVHSIIHQKVLKKLFNQISKKQKLSNII